MSRLTLISICSSKTLMDVALIVPSLDIIANPTVAPSPSPATLLAPLPHLNMLPMWKIALLAAVGAFIVAIIVMGFKGGDECQMTRVEEPPDDEETLQTSLIARTRAPTAAGVRTKPILETGACTPEGLMIHSF